VDYQVRPARITDIDRIVSLCAAQSAMADGSGPLVGQDLLRQLIYLPQASVLVADLRRAIIGVGILALRPSVRKGGYVGTVDVLSVEARADGEQIVGALIEELIRSAKNKGCVLVEAEPPGDPGERARWERQGFVDTGPLLERPIDQARAVSGASQQVKEPT